MYRIKAEQDGWIDGWQRIAGKTPDQHSNFYILLLYICAAIRPRCTGVCRHWMPVVPPLASVQTAANRCDSERPSLAHIYSITQRGWNTYAFLNDTHAVGYINIELHTSNEHWYKPHFLLGWTLSYCTLNGQTHRMALWLWWPSVTVVLFQGRRVCVHWCCGVIK